VVGEFRNGMSSAAWVIASGATFFGFHSQWLAIRPTLAALGLVALHAWPLLLFLAAATSATPVVGCYYALATATADVLGYDVRAFPSPAFMHLAQLGLALVSLPIQLPARGVVWLLRRRQPNVRHDEPSREERAYENDDRAEALESKHR
jgi:hypothetical protein